MVAEELGKYFRPSLEKFQECNVFDRRTAIKGLGVSLTLPWLETFAAKNNAKSPAIKTAFMFMPNGFIMPSWDVQGEEENYELSKTLQPLKAFKNDFNIYQNLKQHRAQANGDGGGDHARNSGTFLTSVQVKKTNGKDIKAGISIDQLAAKQIGGRTELPSLELGCEKGQLAGNCDSGYSCAYSSNISWATEKMPMVKEINPRLAFTRLFGDPKQHLNKREKARLAMEDSSILDLVSAESKSLMKQVSAFDKQKMTEYLDSVRSIEKRLQKVSKESVEIDVPEMPNGVPREFKEHLRLMYEMIVLAFQANKTHIATMMLGNAGSNRRYEFLGQNEGHHALSHHGNDKHKVDMIKKIDLFHVQQFSYFMRRMKETKDGHGTLLDNSMILFGSAISDGNRHSHSDLPILMAGNAGGKLKTGRLIKSKKNTPLSNLFLGMMDTLGVEASNFGDSNGRFI